MSEESGPNSTIDPVATDREAVSVELSANNNDAAGPSSSESVDDTCNGSSNSTSTPAAGSYQEPIAIIDSPHGQAVLVNKLIKTINNLRTENALLEMKITDSDQQNRILQLQIDIMMKKMELIEGFMSQVKSMDDDVENKEEPVTHLCKKCKKQIKKASQEKSPEQENSDGNDDDEVAEDVKQFLDSLNSESADEDEGSIQNPLMIDIIVGHVMKFLPVNMLLKCRLVNRLWNNEATYVLKSRQMLTINGDNIEKLPRFMETFSAGPRSPTTTAGDFPFRHVKFDINFLVKTYRTYIENFFSKFGHLITHFTLNCEQENSAILYTEEVRNVFLPFITNVQTLELNVPTKITEKQTIYDDIRPRKFLFENLTKLKLRQVDATLDIGGYSVSATKEILKLGPRLRVLAIETHTKEVLTRILLALSDKECRAVVNQLEELYLDAFVTEEHLRLLLPLDFKLAVLQMSYFTVEVTTSMLEALLTKHRTTLRTLILGDYQKRTTQNSLPLIIKLPVVRELRCLKFVDPLFPDQRQLILNPLNYSDQLPNLVELSFDHEVGKPAGPHYFQDMFVCSPSPCSSLRTLRISHGLAEPHLVTSAAKMFPNLRTLELANATDAVIQTVWREFTWIKVLYLCLNPTNLNIDSLMTGVPDQVCRRIQEKNLFAQVDLMNAIDIIRTEAAICYLNELETLRIDGITSSLMTAVTGYLAFCHMPNLSNISIKADIVTLSRECRRVLGETLHLSLLEFY